MWNELTTSFLGVWTELAPWLALGVAAATVLHRVLPAGFAARRLAGRGSVLRAVALGVPLPLCSCGVLPTGLGLRKAGAGRGATVAFITSTPQTGADSIFVSASLLGWPFALFKLLSAALTGWVAGVLTDRAGSSSESAQPAADASHGSRRPTTRESLQHGVEILQMVWPWVLLGTAVSAVLDVAVPQAWWSGVQSLGLWPSLMFALALSLPVYVCATGSVPIAATLVAHGFPAGAALVFLMAGPATNAGTIGALWRELGRTAALIYLGTLVGGSLLAGFLFSGVLPAVEVAPHSGHHGVLGWAFGIALGLFVGVDGLLRLRRRLSKPPTAGWSFQVEGMTCGGCERKLTRHLEAVPGVMRAEVHRHGAQVEGPTSVDAVLRAIREAGFTGTYLGPGRSRPPQAPA